MNDYSIFKRFRSLLERLNAGMWGWFCKKWGWNVGLVMGLVVGLASIRKITNFQ